LRKIKSHRWTSKQVVALIEKELDEMNSILRDAIEKLPPPGYRFQKRNLQFYDKETGLTIDYKLCACSLDGQPELQWLLWSTKETLTHPIYREIRPGRDVDILT
jgi:hypothetical protein